nr:uncharacterized protein LOC129254430 [Lytechinus pictus]XP_054748870.1 uncharacterized protein LOC129254430 [Lytechinus pictus]
MLRISTTTNMMSTSNLAENETLATTTATVVPNPADNGVVLSCSWAENGPNRTRVEETLSLWFDAHVYMFASSNVIMLVYAIYAIIQVFRQHRTRKRLSVALHAMIAMTSLTRSCSLLIDPYSLRGVIPCPLNVIIWSLGWPGVVSSYSIFFLVALETTNLAPASRRFQRFLVLLVIITVSIGYVLFADLLVSFIPSSSVAFIVCEIIFIVWGFVLTIGFVYVWWKIRKNLSASCPRNTRERRRSSLNGSLVAVAKNEARRLTCLVTILITSAVICLILTLSHVGLLIGTLYRSFLDFEANPFQWILFQTGQRILEIVLCVLIAIAMLNSSHNHQQKKSDLNRDTNFRTSVANGLVNRAIDCS